MKHRIRLFLMTFFLLGAAIANAEDISAHPWPNTDFYVGLGLGYGDTDWSQLVDSSRDPLVDLSSPIIAQTGGMSWEGFIGYNLSSYFAIEARYTHYPDANIIFSHITLNEIVINGHSIPLPFPIPNPYGMFEFTSHTQAYALVGKFSIPVSKAYHLKAFASLGVDYTMRKDVLVNTLNSYNPTFGGGIDWQFAPRFKTTFEFQYSTGNGAATFDPARQFVPFLYNVDLRLSYLFNL